MGISKIKPLTSQYHSVGGSRGRGLLCLAPQLVFLFLLSEINGGKIFYSSFFYSSSRNARMKDLPYILAYKSKNLQQNLA